MSEAHAGMMVTPSVRLVRPLGEGGMGAVWVADHLALHTQVVVKFIASGLQDSKEATDRFSREAAAAAQVKSPHVVQTFDHGLTADGVPYIVMELLEGQDLSSVLDNQGRCAPDLVVEIVNQLARALGRAHERGIIHRDIKPGNIFLCDGGSGEVFVKLLDFGIAKGVDVPHIDSGTKTGAVVGSPYYMSPEQILGAKNIDARSDLWSLGVVAFEALTGQRPFDAETMGGLAIRIHSEPLPLPSEKVNGLSPAVDVWFARACARTPSERFASAKEMADALAAAIGATTPRAASLPRVSEAPRTSTVVSPVGAHEPTLAAGATTEAGFVSAASPARKSTSRTRNLVLSLVAFGAVLGVGTLGAVTALRGEGDAAADAPTSEPLPASRNGPPPSLHEVSPAATDEMAATEASARSVELAVRAAASEQSATPPAGSSRPSRVEGKAPRRPSPSSPSSPASPSTAVAPTPTIHDIF